MVACKQRVYFSPQLGRMTLLASQGKAEIQLGRVACHFFYGLDEGKQVFMNTSNCQVRKEESGPNLLLCICL